MIDVLADELPVYIRTGLVKVDIFSAEGCLQTSQIKFPSQGEGDCGGASTKDVRVDEERTKELEKELWRVGILRMRR